tara:strand:+ start:358 stop:1203 length:846 start_codon:yes stop_codon:yes gene_type:complete
MTAKIETTYVRSDFVNAFETTLKAETAIVQTMQVVAKQSGELGKAVDQLAIQLASWMASAATDNVVPSDKDCRAEFTRMAKAAGRALEGDETGDAYSRIISHYGNASKMARLIVSGRGVKAGYRLGKQSAFVSETDARNAKGELKKDMVPAVFVCRKETFPKKNVGTASNPNPQDDTDAFFLPMKSAEINDYYRVQFLGAALEGGYKVKSDRTPESEKSYGLGTQNDIRVTARDLAKAIRKDEFSDTMLDDTRAVLETLAKAIAKALADDTENAADYSDAA